VKFKSKGYISTKGKNTVEVEGVKYWISGHDIAKIARTKNIQTDGLRACELGIDGVEVSVVVHKDDFGCWAELDA
jgi:hypothetical protein